MIDMGELFVFIENKLNGRWLTLKGAGFDTLSAHTLRLHHELNSLYKELNSVS
jgi:hypothetical protein